MVLRVKFTSAFILRIIYHWHWYWEWNWYWHWHWVSWIKFLSLLRPSNIKLFPNDKLWSGVAFSILVLFYKSPPCVHKLQQCVEEWISGQNKNYSPITRPKTFQVPKWSKFPFLSKQLLLNGVKCCQSWWSTVCGGIGGRSLRGSPPYNCWGWDGHLFILAVEVDVQQLCQKLDNLNISLQFCFTVLNDRQYYDVQWT